MAARDPRGQDAQGVHQGGAQVDGVHHRHLQTRLQEIKLAVADGASEIDIVINRKTLIKPKN